MSILYNIIIQPLIFLYDLLFTLLSRAFKNPVTAILGLSLVVNFIALPLYKKADDLQKEEQNKKKSMSSWVKHINQNFHGDEKFMILQAYYKIAGYNPLNFIQEAVPLLLQIPLFIAAYRFISSLSVLDGASFGPIANLIEPDHLLVIGSVNINVLPILMTAINLASSYVYTKGSTIQLKVQTVVTALIFLVLLYNSPSGLVIYWTFNQIFSFGKNIVLKLSGKHRKYVHIAIAVFLLFITENLIIRGRVALVLAELIIIGTIVYIISQAVGDKITDAIKKHVPILKGNEQEGSYSTVFFIEAGLALLLGVFIPSNVLSSSVVDFMDHATENIPYELVTYPATVYAGLILLWLTVVYFSNSKRGRKNFTIVLMSVLVFSLLNQFVFSKSFGSLYTDLKFDGSVEFPALLVVINILVGLAVLAICTLVYYRKPKLIRNFAAILCIALACLCVPNLYTIKNEKSEYMGDATDVVSYDGIFRLSRTEKNVVVVMLDRAIGGFVPYIFEEKPELKDSYEGFVFFPNTLSFGTHTNFGAPGLFGGYEYTPAEMNKRTNLSLAEKHDEALKLMPVLFLENGYDVAICDPPYAGYREGIPDLNIYDDYPDIRTYNLEGEFSEQFNYELTGNDFSFKQKRNFMVYSLFRVSPMFLRSFVYDGGNYIYNAAYRYYTPELIDSYSTLASFVDLTAADDESKGSFLLLQNSTPHNPTVLDPPDYELNFRNQENAKDHANSLEMDGYSLDLSMHSQWAHYCINAATYKELAKWLDYLKEEGVYDNTRIILVADHGYYLNQYKGLNTPGGPDIESFNPLLMVKDFNAHEEWSIDKSFMTNADVPFLALEGIIDNPVNPFTGNLVNIDMKKQQSMLVTDSDNYSVEYNNGKQFDTTGANWWAVKDNIYDLDNWKKIDRKEVENR